MVCCRQSTKCKLERVGVRKALTLLKAKQRQSFKSPFDVITDNYGFEVKAISANSKDKKIHISDSSFRRKLEFAEKHNIEPLLLAVVISDNEAKLYQSRLVQSIRINQMLPIN
jgi:hypothetical protein